MSLTIERTVLTQLVSNEEYTRKVLPFLKGDYFSDRSERIVFEEITKFVEKYNKVPTKTSLEIEVQSRKDLNESDFKNIISLVKSLQNDENVNFDWLVDTTEQFCKDKAVYNAIVESIQIIDGKDKSRNADAIPSILTDALAVGFDNRVGHDYLSDSSERPGARRSKVVKPARTHRPLGMWRVSAPDADFNFVPTYRGLV